MPGMGSAFYRPKDFADGWYDMSNFPPGTFGAFSKGWIHLKGGKAVNISPTPPARPATPAANPQSAGPTPAPVQPFNTPDEQLEWSDRWSAHNSKLFDIDSALNTLRTDTQYQKDVIDFNLKRDVGSSVDNMIARGLGQSSIQDAELNDLNASALNRKNYLNTTLSNADLAANAPGGQKDIENQAWNGFVNWFNNRAVANASAANANRPAPAAAPAAPAAPGAEQFMGFGGTKPIFAGPRGETLFQNSKGTWGYTRASDGKFIPYKG